MRRALFTATICLLASLAVAQEKNSYSRIVSIGGSLTEIVYELGAEDLLIAVDTTSGYPESALAKLPNVGYMRTLSAEPILALNPDLVMVSSDAGPLQVLDQLREAGTKVVVIEDLPSVEGIYGKILEVSKLVDRDQQGQFLIETIRADFIDAMNLISQVEDHPRVLFLLSVGSGAPLAAGEATSANTVIKLAGGQNVMSQMNGYKPVSPESIVVGAPDFVLIPQRAFDLFGSIEAVFKLPDLIATPAAQNQNLLVFDGLYLMGFGPRSVKAVLDLAKALHPNLGSGE
ncbi:MAG: iron complex transport system substrate-binding protein [Paracoccaceae bacterium]|jgi:iron complex transport system substrate-binding protein